MKITDLLNKNAIQLNGSFKNKEEAIDRLIELMTSNGNISDSLNIHIYDMNDVGSLNIAYDYQINKYTSKDVEDLHSRIMGIIEQILDNPSILLKDIHVLTSIELDEIRNHFAHTQVPFDFCDNILKQIEINAKDHLDKVAIETATDSITYAELFKRVNQLSNFLLDYGVSSNTNIGIFTDRTIDAIIGILSILKIGSTYVPIDPEYPKDRINYMIDKANLEFILTDNLINQT